MRPRRPSWLLAATVSGSLGWFGCGVAAAQAISPARSGGGITAVPVASTPAPEFRPSMGDLMTLLIQPRHTKLGLAGAQRNWTYAAYELGELRNAFGRVARTVPVYNGMDTAALMADYIKAPIDALEQSIKAGSSTGFRRDYRTLTATCNACHTGLKHGAVVIQEPVSSPYPDQDFSRPSRSGR